MENGSSATVEDAQPDSSAVADAAGAESDTGSADAELEDAEAVNAESEGTTAGAESKDSAAAEESAAALREALATAQAEAETQKDRALRAAAEAENVRKRADRRVENAHKFALEGFVADLLPAVDSFERAALSAEEAAKEAAENAAKEATETASGMAAVAEGVQLSLKLLVEAMQRQGIEVVDPLGAPFDPNLHEAMTMVASETAEPGSVVEVFQKGYTVNGRLARAARVVVAKAPEASADSPADNATDDGEGGDAA